MATTIYNNKYPIPEGFHDILHDFIKEIIRAQPNDIFDFGIQYFSKLETGQEPNKQKANSVVYPSGETSTINTKSNFYENNTQIQINQIVENPIREKISDENTPIGTSANVEANNYRPPSRLTTMSVNSTIKNDAREFIGNVLSESKINNATKEKRENNENDENDEINNQNENVENVQSENNENNENIQSENNENVEKVQSENNENIQSENVENNENVQSENYENIENIQSENVQSENNENTNENKNENEENNYEEDNIDQNYNIEENNNDINESINSKNKSNSYSINSTQKNDAKEFVEEVLSESKKSFH